MSITGNWDWRISRRDFLAMTGMSTAALALSTSGLSVLGNRALAQTTLSEYPSSLSNPFTLGVASGDPITDGAGIASIVLWTRLAPGEPGDKLGPLNGGGMPTSNVQVDWQVAKDENFTNIVAGKGQPSSRQPAYEPFTTAPELAHSVHLEVTGLEAEAQYYYRFLARDYEVKGRTKTAPKPSDTPLQLKFAVASCQSYQAGYWAPFRDIASQDLDCVVHVGDYTYEYGTWTGYSGPWKLYRTAATTDLRTYRNRHAEYKWKEYMTDDEPARYGSDAGLQDAHAKHPWICVWDDHEGFNDYAGGDLTSAQQQRRNAAYQAYYEHMPIRPSRIKSADWSSVELYYDIAYGKLARFCVLDTRQYRSKHACGTTSLANCSDRFQKTLNSKQHTILGRGDTQETWLRNALDSSYTEGTTWNVLANQVRMIGYDHEKRQNRESYRMEEWDGYVATRNRISQHINGLIEKGKSDGKVFNTVSVTGDLHCAFAADLKYHPTDPNRSYKRSDSKTIGAELIGTSVCSDLGGWRSTYENSVGDNPHVKYLNTNEGGYLLCTVDSKTLRTDYRQVIDGDAPLGDGRYSPTSGMKTIATATVVSGTPGLLDGSVSGAGSVSLSPEVRAEEQPRREKPPRTEPPRGRDTR